MIKHILKVVWNQRRKYGGIFVEQIAISIILMLSIVSVVDATKRYMSPGLPDVDNTCVIGYLDRSGQKEQNAETQENARKSMYTVIENLRKLPFVEAITICKNLIPYMRPDWNYYMSSDSITVDEQKIKTVIKISDEFGAAVLKPEIEEGTWFENRVLPDGSAPVVITRQLADKAGWTTAAGKKFTCNSQPVTVVGVVAGLKQQAFDPSPAVIVFPEYASREGIGEKYFESGARIKAGSQKDFYESFSREFKRLMSDKNVEPIAFKMEILKRTFMQKVTLQIVLQAVPTLFLFIFAFIGTFGLSWMISSKRLKEFALRIALGSTKKQLMTIVIGENLLVTVIAVIPALTLSVFIYEYTAVHAVGVGATILVMLLFSFVSAWYPAWTVSKVNPAEAIKYE
jgi:ABC-type antimicrobial peptide transport system permease subunit